MKHLPEPDVTAKIHSTKLQHFIQAEIHQQGGISFARYMELALYSPGLGYYSAGSHKLGKGGDFVTAPEISPLFSRCLARQCQQVLQKISQADILELGAGSGIMACDILTELEAAHCLPEHYYILEVSADLKQRQQQLLKEKIPQLFERIIWLDTLTNFHIKGVIIANEVIDALPVHIFRIHHDLQECYITENHGALNYEWRAASTPLEKRVKNLAIEFENNYQSEINLMLDSWLAQISHVLQQGLILLIDYGFSRAEYYHPDRSMGTLMCHYRHRAHDNPLLYPGLQDITAHADFTSVADAAEQSSLTVAGYTTQANFLLSCGISEMTTTHEHADEQLQLSQQLKTLLMPGEMGEIFKVMALTRQLDIPLLGFSLYDKRERL